MAKSNQTTKDDVTVVDAKPRQKRRLVLIIAIILLVVAGAGGYFAYVRHKHNVAANNAILQHSFESELSTALDSSNADQTVVYATTNLINGAQSGKFKISDSKLGWYHMDRANAYVNLSNNSKAVPDYESAARLNSSLKLPAMQGEFQTRYETGERQQLIRLLQQLVQAENNSENPMRSSEAAQYQYDIQAIQQGQEITF